MTSSTVYNPDLPIQLIKDKHVLTEAIRKFATHLTAEAATQQSRTITFSFERNNLFHLSAMLFQLVVIAEETEAD